MAIMAKYQVRGPVGELTSDDPMDEALGVGRDLTRDIHSRVTMTALPPRIIYSGGDLFRATIPEFLARAVTGVDPAPINSAAAPTVPTVPSVPTPVQAVQSSVQSPGFSLSSIPWWGWLAAGGAALFAFGGGRGR